jgi:hypothetical protein
MSAPFIPIGSINYDASAGAETINIFTTALEAVAAGQAGGVETGLVRLPPDDGSDRGLQLTIDNRAGSGDIRLLTLAEITATITGALVFPAGQISTVGDIRLTAAGMPILEGGKSLFLRCETGAHAKVSAAVTGPGY